MRRVDEALHLAAGPFVGLGGALGQQMHSAVHVRVVLQVVVGDRVDHCARLLAGRRAVEVDERLAADPLLEDGEVCPHAYVQVPRRPAVARAKTLPLGANPASSTFSHSATLNAPTPPRPPPSSPPAIPLPP